MKSVTQLPEIGNLPDLLRFENGDAVQTPGDWKRRRAELISLYSEYVYGYMPDKAKETVEWQLREDLETGGKLLTITISAEGRSASFSVLAGLPAGTAPEDGSPFYIVGQLPVCHGKRICLFPV